MHYKQKKFFVILRETNAKRIFMENKNILGLDLGTNSIGWAVVGATYQKEGDATKVDRILGVGSRIIPMDAAMQGDFDNGNSISQTAERTRLRGARRLIERKKLRRERLHRVLNKMELLPPHYKQALNRYGKFVNDEAVLLPWVKSEGGEMSFLFQTSYQEMLQFFYDAQPQLMERGLKVPYDWTIYYLREKALSKQITDYELAWLLLHFNQKRGYYQTRGENQAMTANKKEEYYALKVVDVQDSGDKKGKDIWWNVLLENGMVYRTASNIKPDWTGRVKEFIVTTHLNGDGTPKLDKDGRVKRSFRIPKEKEWNLIKIKTQHDITNSGLTVGSYIFKSLLANPMQKIIGRLVRTVERDFYKDELRRILLKQQELNPKLQDHALYQLCIEELYQQNVAYRNSISQKDFVYLLMDDILFYHRPLKSKKSLIDDCPYEHHFYVGTDGVKAKKALKCVSKSHPLYQEFRLWQFIGNLHLYRLGKDLNGRTIEEDVTAQFLPGEEDVVRLFDYLNDLKEVDQSVLLKYFGIAVKKGVDCPYRWNYVEDKKYPCNTTREMILHRLNKAKVDATILKGEAEQQLWHILYSVTDAIQLPKALKSYAQRYNLSDDFVSALASCPPFESTYGAYSLKALKRLLPLMRRGKYWSWDQIDSSTQLRIEHLISGEADEGISERVREKLTRNAKEEYCGLSLWEACYVVYNRHSEASDTSKWQNPDDIDEYLRQFRQHSLRNPIVEQVVTETLRTVRDIWKQYGHIDEIHLELGRQMKNPADKRARDTKKMTKNETANLRIKALLQEFMNPEYGIENVRPYSPSQQELLRIYEDTALGTEALIDEEINDIISRFAHADVSKRPTPREVMRYKLWLEQRYVSPYTGQAIPLSRLFTSDYQIEHIIPQSRYFDDSLSNKVICEAEVNKLKDNALGYEFIQKHHGEVVQLSGGRNVTIFNEEQYCQHVEQTYKHNNAKKKKLLADDIPSEFVARQMNDSRYISKFVMALLSKIVRTDDEAEATSKNLIVCSGGVTDRLKQDWGVNEVWNRIILPRFERMNQLTNSELFTTKTAKGHKIPDMPLDLQKGFNKKRIDHRHHAMDAVVIACATRQHVSLLNNEAALGNNANRYQLSHKLRRYEDALIERNGTIEKRSVPKEFIMPWATFPADLYSALQGIIVSFKQNLRVINKTTNYNTRFVNGKKQLVRQTLGDSWAVRKSMHKDTVFGEVNLRKVVTVKLGVALAMPNRIVNSELKGKVKELQQLQYTEKQIKAYLEENADVWSDVNTGKIEVYQFTRETNERYFATRKPISSDFDEKKIRNHVTDTGIQKIMLAHLQRCNGDATQAFSPEGIEDMNRDIVQLNGGKSHQPIYSVRVYEKAGKFAVGKTGNKAKKYVEADQGTNLFFVVREVKELNKKTGEEVKKRAFATIPFNEAVVKMKQGVALAKDALFVLSPGDLVYVPTEEELRNGHINQPIDRSRIYKFVDSSGTTANFVPCSSSNVIFSMKKDKAALYCKGSVIVQDEWGVGSPQSKNQKTIGDEMIKDICIPIKVDRLGNIIKMGVD